MNLKYQWHSFQGTVTSDSRDYCGVAERQEATMYIVVDGSSRGPSAGELAQNLVKYVVNEFLIMEEPTESDSINNLLIQAHQNFRYQYVSDSASYCIAILTNSTQLMVYYSGDCRLGKINMDGAISWLTCPHTMTNAVEKISEEELINSPIRHILTRSFRSQRFQQPEFFNYSLEQKETLIIATDGFWADISPEIQTKLIKGERLTKKAKDDISFILLKEGLFNAKSNLVDSNNFYLQSSKKSSS